MNKSSTTTTSIDPLTQDESISKETSSMHEGSQPNTSVRDYNVVNSEDLNLYKSKKVKVEKIILSING